MTENDPLTFDGITQPISEWALDYGIPASLIIDRLAEGQSAETAITTMMPFEPEKPTRKRDPRSHVYEHDGKLMTIREWAEYVGIPRSTLSMHLRSGMPIADAINKALHVVKNPTYEYAGESKTLADWARSTGIKYPTLRQRIVAQGKTIGEAIEARKFAKPNKAKTPNQAKTPSTRGLKAGSVVVLVGSLRIEISGIGPGVGLNFGASKGTGAGSTAREIPEIGFPKEAP